MYNALLDDHEEECTLDCGCKLKRMHNSSVALTFCQRHNLAFDAVDKAYKSGLNKAAAICAHAATCYRGAHVNANDLCGGLRTEILAAADRPLDDGQNFTLTPAKR